MPDTVRAALFRIHTPREMALNLWSPRDQKRESLWRKLSPPQLFVGSFALLTLLGTLGFKALPGLYTGAPLSWLDALFTATSAVCVTGLIVVDTATYFTPAGQAFILLLIQLGGLGIITFSTLIIVAFGRRLSLRHEVLVSGMADVAPHVDRRRLVFNVFVFTFSIEAAGAVLLYVLWIPRMGVAGAAWPALFHSISAFCNAGFSTFTHSLVSFQQSPLVLSVIMALIVVGGLGFLTLEELYLWRRARQSQTRFSLSLHSRIVLVATGVLLVIGWVFFTLFEWDVTFRHMPVWAKLVNGLFASVTPRTAGFNSIDYGLATDSTNFLTTIFMFIGGSPGSTAGGVKTTTVALILLMAWARMRGEATPSFWGRSIPQETSQRAIGLFVVAAVLMTLCIFVFTTSEIESNLQAQLPRSFLQHTFEIFSAFNTVGLSMGVTGTLSPVGRWTPIFLMFLGRVGPLTFAAALASRRRLVGGFRFAYEDVIVG